MSKSNTIIFNIVTFAIFILVGLPLIMWLFVLFWNAGGPIYMMAWFGQYMGPFVLPAIILFPICGIIGAGGFK